LDRFERLYSRELPFNGEISIDLIDRLDQLPAPLNYIPEMYFATQYFVRWLPNLVAIDARPCV